MYLDLNYVCEFCHVNTRKVHEVDVGREGEAPRPSSIMMVCRTCRDAMCALAESIENTSDPHLEIDIVAQEICTTDTELLRTFAYLAKRRRRYAVQELRGFDPPDANDDGGDDDEPA
jgi:hypothetical protein